MKYPFEPPDFEPGDRVRLMPPSPEAPPYDCGHTPLEVWQHGEAEAGMRGIVIRGNAKHAVYCPVCNKPFWQDGVGVEVPGRPDCLVSPWTLELVDAT